MSLPFSPGRQDRGVAISDLVRELFSKISEFIQTQLELTKTEIKVESRKLVMAGAYGVAALMIGSVFILFMGVSITLALMDAVGLVWAAVITTVVYLMLAGLAVTLMISELRKNNEKIDVE
jgi:uncharacterized membrane protein YqjE